MAWGNHRPGVSFVEGQLSDPSPVCGAPAGLTATCGFAGLAGFDDDVGGGFGFVVGGFGLVVVGGGGVPRMVKPWVAFRPSVQGNDAVYLPGVLIAVV